MRKKIVYLTSTLKKTGPIDVLFDILKNLDKTKYEPILVTFKNQEKDSKIDDFIKLGIRIEYLNLDTLKTYLFGGFFIRKLMKQIKPDIIQVQNFLMFVLTGFSLFGYKRCAIVQCDYPCEYEFTYGKKLSRIMVLLQTIALAFIKNIYCASKMTAGILQEKFPFLKFDYVDDSVDTERFSPEQNKQSLREKLNIPEDKKVFIWVGVLNSRKDPLLLASAIKNIENKENFYILCGGGDFENELKKATSDLSNVLLTGQISMEELVQYLKASDYYVSTSHSEGLPLSVLEGLSCGLPIVVSDIEQHKYIFKEENIGLVFEDKNQEDLENKLKAITECNYDEYSINARNLVLKYFSSKTMTKNYQKKYEEILK